MFVQRPGPILGSGLSAGPSPFFTAVGAAAWRCSNRRATGVESLAELQPTHRQVAGFRFSGARAQIRGFGAVSAALQLLASAARQCLVMSFQPGESSRRETPMIMKDPPGGAARNPRPSAHGMTKVTAGSGRSRTRSRDLEIEVPSVRNGARSRSPGPVPGRQPCPPCGPRSHRSGGRRPTADAKTRLSAGMAMLARRRKAVDARLPYRGQALNYSYRPPQLSMVPGDGGPDVGAFLRADRGCSFM
jgi:hypothetical protein